jgi:predicted short-subunit dehydrogenase-like oxidoreductase (DUF2520 family)
MQTFPPGSSPDLFEGIYVGLEGNPEAVAMGRRIASALKALPIVIPSEAKARYHLAGSIASNFAVTLAALASEVLASIDVPYEQGRAMLKPLVTVTLQNLASKTPAESLTGPIVRGDTETVAAHLDALHRYLPHLTSAYTTLSAVTVHVAVQSGRLSEASASAMLQLLYPPTPDGDLR